MRFANIDIFVGGVVQIHRVLLNVWRDSRGRVRELTIGVSDLYDKEQAAVNAIKTAFKRKKKKLSIGNNGCSYIDKFKGKLTCLAKEVIDVSLCADSLFSAGKIKFYNRDTIDSPCSLRPKSAKQYLEEGNGLEYINSIISNNIKGLIEVVEAVDEDHEDSAQDIVEQKKFKCRRCPRSYTLKSNLTRHENTHEGLKTFKCDKCQRGFVYKSSLTRHNQGRCIRKAVQKNRKLGIKSILASRKNSTTTIPDPKPISTSNIPTTSTAHLASPNDENQTVRLENQSLRVENQSLRVENQSLRDEIQNLRQENDQSKIHTRILKNERDALRIRLNASNRESVSKSSNFEAKPRSVLGDLVNRK
ncbi:PR domain zinc finger protein 16 [Folsomia candida]|uniref:PR domain zinc finger protein 16 n=1 Tax=Folsomia candida TaxID=158441 RepID=A0A226F0U7_FOLCA|nr:PR domain zinc finger protein 16 [Folsomia candida]